MLGGVPKKETNCDNVIAKKREKKLLAIDCGNGIAEIEGEKICGNGIAGIEGKKIVGMDL